MTDAGACADRPVGDRRRDVRAGACAHRALLRRPGTGPVPRHPVPAGSGRRLLDRMGVARRRRLAGGAYDLEPRRRGAAADALAGVPPHTDSSASTDFPRVSASVPRTATTAAGTLNRNWRRHGGLTSRQRSRRASAAVADRTKGFLPADEAAALRAAAAGAVPGGAEVGTYCGKSTVHLGAVARDRGAALVSVDHHHGSEREPTRMGMARPLAGRPPDRPARDPAVGAPDAVRRRPRGLSPCPVVGRTEDVARWWSATPLTLLFLDGNHTYDVAQHDYAAFGRHLVTGGLLAVHDVFPDPRDGGQAPWRVVRRAQASGAFARSASTARCASCTGPVRPSPDGTAHRRVDGNTYRPVTTGRRPPHAHTRRIPMAKKSSPNRVAQAARTGLRELPSNAAWLLPRRSVRQRAEPPSSSTRCRTPRHRAPRPLVRRQGRVRRRAADAGRSVADAMPGLHRDAVSDLMHEADDAAEQARLGETEAVRLAQRAKDDADQAARIANDGDRDVQRARKDAEDRVRARVERGPAGSRCDSRRGGARAGRARQPSTRRSRAPGGKPTPCRGGIRTQDRGEGRSRGRGPHAEGPGAGGAIPAAGSSRDRGRRRGPRAGARAGRPGGSGSTGGRGGGDSGS